RVLYVTHDVTALLTPGANAIGVMLGNGWYSADDDDPPGRTAYADRPILLLQLNIELVDGRSIHVVSDETWRASAGPITANDYAGGEEYDARLEQPGWDCVAFDDAAWLAADPADAPSGRLVAQSLEPTRIVEKLRPTRMLDSAAGGVIFDMGQHFSGWVQLRAQGRRGTKLTLCHAGRVNYDTVSLDCRNNDFFQPAGQTDTYILKGGGVETWHPRFTLHGFRYVEVLGDAGELTLDSVEGHVVHSAVETSGTFHCANDLLNRIHQNACWTFRSSLQGMPQDASDRAERVGWLGDTGFVAEDYIVNFDTARFWAKWLDDIADAQKPDGEVPHVVPPHWGPDRYVEWPAWQSTYTVIAWHLYQYYGDLRILADHFEGIRRQVEYFRAKSDRHIMRHGLGDHMEPRGDGSSSHFPERTPGPLTGTAYYYFSAWILSQASAALGNDADAERYTKLAEDVREAFNGEFFDPETNQYATGSQTANSLALYLNLVPEGREQEVLANLVDDILNRRRGHLSTGIIGTDALEQALPRYGRADVMYRIATQTTFPSWGYGVVNGATTIWEDWEGSSQRSLSMKMLASVEKFLYRDVAGIGPAEPGYRAIAIRPQLTAALKHASAAVETVYGRAAVDWTKEDDALWLGVTVPPNTTARVSVPKDGLEDVTVTEDGRPIWRDGAFVAGTSGITRGDEDGRYIHFDVDAGAYAFQLTGRPSSARMEDTQ
ncbi:alpha-L-rhamnosidase, partial [Candidatus Poribacteria bacterium]|nr:alpha-L-rhamnosidase [Candidatus Poribacteria bacterium]